MSREGLFAVLYALSAALSIITVASCIAAWLHWNEILDNCSDRYCGCILFGESSPIIFSGGPVELCHFTSFGSIPIFAVALVFACYYGYRACFYKKATRASNKRRNQKLMVVRSAEEDRLSGTEELGFKRWLCLMLLASVCVLLLLTTAVILTMGYHTSCGQYREMLVKNLGAMPQVSMVIYERLDCSAVFDFMDLMEPTTRPFLEKEGQENYYLLSDHPDRYRGDLIDTGAALLVAIISVWLHSVVWILIIFLDVKLYRRCRCC